MEAAPVEGITSAAQANAADRPAGQQSSSSFAAGQDLRGSTAPHNAQGALNGQQQNGALTRQREASQGSSASDSDESQRTRVQGHGQGQKQSGDHKFKENKKAQQTTATLLTPGGTRLPQVARQTTGYFGEQRVGEAVDVKSAEEAFRRLTRVLSTSPHDFDLESHINLRQELLARKGGVKRKYLGTTWENLTVVGKDSTGAFVKTLPDALLRTLLAKDFIEFVVGRIPSLTKILPGKKQKTRKLIQNFEGCVSQEMVSSFIQFPPCILEEILTHCSFSPSYSCLFSEDLAQDAPPSSEQ